MRARLLWETQPGIEDLFAADGLQPTRARDFKFNGAGEYTRVSASMSELALLGIDL